MSQEVVATLAVSKRSTEGTADLSQPHMLGRGELRDNELHVFQKRQQLTQESKKTVKRHESSNVGNAETNSLM